MKIEIKTIDVKNITKENIFELTNPQIREYIRNLKWKLSNGLILNFDAGKILDNSKDTADFEFSKLVQIIPEYYLYIDPGKDESWFNESYIADILSSIKTKMVVVRTFKMTKPAVDEFINNMTKCQHESFPTFMRVSNPFDYEHVVFAVA